MATVLLSSAALFMTCLICDGVFISPIAYTLTDVESVNGSSVNGSCPQECEGMASGVRRCDCRSSSTNITGVLIDGMVPTIDSSMRGHWEAELYTVETTMTTLPIGFLFQSSVMLREVELYVFYCPAWDIGADNISVYNGVSFPNFVRIGASAENVGSVTLISDMQNCEDLTRVSIPLQMATSTSSYFIEFTNLTPPHQLYIAEVRFSDQPISPPTEPATATTLTADLPTTAVSTTETTTPPATTLPTGTTSPSQTPNVTTTTIITPPTTAEGTFPLSAAISGGAVGGVLVLSLLVVMACAVILSYRKKEKRKKNHSRKDTELEIMNVYSDIEGGLTLDTDHQHTTTISRSNTQDTIIEGSSDSLHVDCIQCEGPTVSGHSAKQQKNSIITAMAERCEDLNEDVKCIGGEIPDYQEDNSSAANANIKRKDLISGGACSLGDNLDSAESAEKYNGGGKCHNKEVVEKQALENIYSVVRKTKKDKALKGSAEGGNNIPIPQEELEQLVYAPIYDVSALDMESLKLPKLTPENIKKVKTLGSGQFGKVILADTVDLSPKDLGLSDTDDDKSKSTCVAVKTLKGNPTASMKEAFEKELKFMSRLKHPNIIRTLGACMTIDTPFVVMEYMVKGDLNEYLQEFDIITPGNIPPNILEISAGTLTNMSAQIASAMAYLTHRNFIHRDLATRNCLVGPDLEIKIADFGLSRNLYKSQYYLIQGHAVLPVRWMARESFYGKFSAKSDVWSFGVTMWEIFTLAKDIPYEDMDDNELVCDASNKSTPRKLLERPKDCPQKVYDIMLMCWAEDPHERATFEELYEVLSSVSFDAVTEYYLQI